jgi:hypothetical protein
MTSLNNRRNSDGMGDDNDDVIGVSNFTSAATTSVLNMVDTPQIQTSTLTEGDTSTRLSQHRKPRQCQPSHTRVKELLCKAVIPSERDAFLIVNVANAGYQSQQVPQHRVLYNRNYNILYCTLIDMGQ